MDAKLLAWARAVKRRRRSKNPVLWLFTDAERLPDPLAAISALPKNLAGVVFRHDPVAARASLAHQVSARCRALRIPLVVAGDARLAAAIGAGIHLRAGYWPGRSRTRRLITSSAHNSIELRRARLRGARIIFLSPAFTTLSHPDAPVLGAIQWLKIARHARKTEVYSLGGINGDKIRILAPFCAGAGGIQALIP